MSDSPEQRNPLRRLAGIAALLICALVFDPTRVLPDIYSLAEIDLQVMLHAVIVPTLAAVGLWLVLPNVLVLAICTMMLSIAHTRTDSSDLFAGYLYPIVALVAGLVVGYTLFVKRSTEERNG